ncbi:UDP-N-acetylmuramoyl-tripeptide--D-alanyl-D-alanine ligase [Albidovulum inexpectatum]|uniref:UDP-N-acetylmuramoyl-tripeptide--D-alanyl-D-alanine ligase n=1 Tax=Albidovulum inexpectatum TaxID=196587 RepID=A0A2S5JHW8_9RHOB|nr:UDP-N-acetylmuramoyl-tripeptide--D-alanyl-D-alanine ligase [Albidovulum inexpectatum]PPB81124.1 UDP-N-acetylmuramoyl-tripeptide--D-alanyl-D-alanine ligase [Albidovulum inexpectatum]
MSALWTGAEAARAIGGRLTRDFEIAGLSIDTRTIRPGEMFIALTDRRDGHDFVADALARGASGAMVSRVPDNVDSDAPLLIVPDVLRALWDLGAAGRARTGARVIAVTGSVGKTSTKEMLRAMLSGQGRVHAAEASFNNHWGVPLTLARMPREADFAVIEIGMNRPGEIAPLARLARPHVAMITTVAPAHLEAFGEIAGIAREKSSIFEGLEPDGTAIIPSGLETTPILAKAAARASRIMTFGAEREDDFRLLEVMVSQDRTVARVGHADGQVLLRLNGPGRHFATNALGVLAVARALDLDLAVSACDLARWQPPAGRGQREVIHLDIVNQEQSFDLIDDAFNANPASVSAALDVLASARPRDGIGRIGRGRRIVVLGDMLELGPDEIDLHRQIAAHPAMTSIDIVHCVGPRMRALWQALPDSRRGLWFETADEMARVAHRIVDAGDVVLVKGSKGSRVSQVVDALRKLGQPGADRAQGKE